MTGASCSKDFAVGSVDNADETARAELETRVSRRKAWWCAARGRWTVTWEHATVIRTALVTPEGMVGEAVEVLYDAGDGTVWYSGVVKRMSDRAT